MADIINYSIGVLGILIAIWQIIRNHNLTKYIKAEAIELYLDTDMLRAFAQNGLKSLQSGNANIGIQELGKVEGMAHSLFTRSIKNIHHHFNYNRNDIEKWIKNAKIHAIHKNDFLKYIGK